MQLKKSRMNAEMQRVAEVRRELFFSAFLCGPLRLCVKIGLALMAALPRCVIGSFARPFPSTATRQPQAFTPTHVTFHVSRFTHHGSRLPPCPSRIERLAHQQVQIVDGQRELSIGLGG